MPVPDFADRRRRPSSRFSDRWSALNMQRFSQAFTALLCNQLPTARLREGSRRLLMMANAFARHLKFVRNGSLTATSSSIKQCCWRVASRGMKKSNSLDAAFAAAPCSSTNWPFFGTSVSDVGSERARM
jgi:hypothetical protein